MKCIADPESGDTIDARDTMYPTLLRVLSDKGAYPIHNEGHGTVFGVVVSGVARLNTLRAARYELWGGSYFAFPDTGNISIDNDITKVVLIERYGYRGQHVVGKLEQRGRLSYIDGCSDSMLVYPPRMGDPVLNHLHFPGDILQTQHTHPSIRMGVVMGGEGVSWRGEHGTKDDLRPFMRLAEIHGLEYALAYRDAFRYYPIGDGVTNSTHVHIEFEAGGEKHAVVDTWEKHGSLFSGVDMLYHLKQGGVFLLEEGELHSFATVPGSNMEIVAYHPDSDWGPTDENHPMLNRTYINHGQ